MIRERSQRDQQATRLRQARAAAGFQTPAEAIKKFRWSGSTYMAHENGQNGIRPEPAVAYANAYGVDPGWLLTGFGKGPESTPRDMTNATRTKPDPGLTSDGGVAFNKELPRLPVIGLAACGPDGWFLWNGDVIDTLPRPTALASAKDAYAIYISGESMVPRYYAGEAAYVHPGKPVTVGAFVLVQLKPEADGEAPRAVLKRLVRRSGTKTILEQFNPPKTFELKNDEIQSIHRVVGSVEA